MPFAQIQKNLLYHTEVLIRMHFLNVLTNQNKRYVITQINIEKFLGLCVEYSFTSLLKNIQLYMNVEGFYVETTQVYLGRLQYFIIKTHSYYLHMKSFCIKQTLILTYGTSTCGLFSSCNCLNNILNVQKKFLMVNKYYCWKTGYLQLLCFKKYHHINVI